MNRLMEIKLEQVPSEELENALYYLMEHYVNAEIDPSDLAVELACEIEDSGRCNPVAIWPWNDVDDELQNMDPSDIIDAVESGDNDPCKYWRRINPETNQMESYDDGYEVTEKAFEIIRDNLPEYMAVWGETGCETILDMIGADLDDLCAELDICEDCEEIESVSLYNIAGDEIDIESRLCNPISWERVVELMDDDCREAVHAELSPCTELEFLMEYLKYDQTMPDKIENVFGYIMEVEYA